MAVPLREGGGKGLVIKKKGFFKTFFLFKKKVPNARKLEGGGKALLALPLKK